MKPLSSDYSSIFVVWLLLAVAASAIAGEHKASGDVLNSGPPTGTTHWHSLTPGPAIGCISPPCQPEARGFQGSTIVFHTGIGGEEIILFGGRDSAKVDLNDVWILQDPEDYNAAGCPPVCWINTIKNNVPMSPPARSGHSAVYNADGDRMIIFAGCGGSPCSPFRDVWVLNYASSVAFPVPVWTELSPSTSPPARTKHLAVYDNSTNRMIIFGGQNGMALYDTWVLTSADGTGGILPRWTQLNTFGDSPHGPYGATGVYDAENNILIVFGGSNADANDPLYVNGVWTLSNANGMGGTPTWTKLNISPPRPDPRAFHVAVYDQAHNTMTIFGGSNQNGELGDTWILSNANGMGGTPTWTTIDPSTTPPLQREAHTAAYDPNANIMMMFGGDSGGLDGWFVTPWVLLDANGQ